MKTILVSLAATAAFAAAALAHSSDLRLERRWNAHGQQFFVYVRDAQATTTVGLHRHGRGIGDVRDETDNVRVVKTERPTRFERRFNPHGQQFFLYAPVGSGPHY